MKITKYTHACIRLERDGHVLVIDPGEWTEPEAFVGANAFLVTHEHADHVDPERIGTLGVPVFAPDGATISDVDITPVTTGQVFETAGFTVRSVGARHAVIYDGQPDCPNLGYVVDDLVYHPGDALARPDLPIEVLCVPAQGSWLKLDEALDFVRAIGPRLVLPIHDAGLSERGLASLNAWHGEVNGSSYHYLAPGESLTAVRPPTD